jgi:acyl-homoserine lactone acylase PvdQ
MIIKIIIIIAFLYKVVHGNYTSTGKPMLGNDPHLDNTIPG